jgi:hypothetical protein
MCIALVGGMDRLRRQYIQEAQALGIELRVFSQAGAQLGKRLKGVDAVVLMGSKLSHRARREALAAARAGGVKVLQCRSAGVCGLRDCLSCLRKNL